MKFLYLSSLFIILCCVTKAQLTIVPQVGMESSKTNVSYNNSSKFSPLGAQFSPQANVRLDYKFKKGHGPFVGLGTSRSGVNYTFSDPETGMTNYTASRDNTQLRMEGGYQYTTKPIYFNKSGGKNKSSNATGKSSSTKSSCYSYMESRCGSKSYASSKTDAAKNKGTWMSIQPSAGVAFVPTASDAEIATNTNGTMTSYEYAAGNFKTAAMAGVGFIFGKNDQQKLLVSVNYLKGIGNLETETLTTTTGIKPTTTTMSSNVSNWNVRVGIPFNLTKTKKPTPQKEVIIIKQRTEVKQPAQVQQPKQEKKCGSYMYRCRKAA